MLKIPSELKIFMNMSRVNSSQSRRFSGTLNGLGFTEFQILYHLSNAPGQRMRRIDIANAVGLTASGITRILSPMEKIGLVSKEAHARDARVRYVAIAPSGERMLDEGVEMAQHMAEEKLAVLTKTEIKTLSDMMKKIGGQIE